MEAKKKTEEGEEEGEEEEEKEEVGVEATEEEESESLEVRLPRGRILTAQELEGIVRKGKQKRKQETAKEFKTIIIIDTEEQNSIPETGVAVGPAAAAGEEAEAAKEMAQAVAPEVGAEVAPPPPSAEEKAAMAAVTSAHAAEATAMATAASMAARRQSPAAAMPVEATCTEETGTPPPPPRAIEDPPRGRRRKIRHEAGGGGRAAVPAAATTEAPSRAPTPNRGRGLDPSSSVGGSPPEEEVGAALRPATAPHLSPEGSSTASAPRNTNSERKPLSQLNI